jgi:hypothetical protein
LQPIEAWWLVVPCRNAHYSYLPLSVVKVIKPLVTVQCKEEEKKEGGRLELEYLKLLPNLTMYRRHLKLLHCSVLGNKGLQLILMYVLPYYISHYRQ